VSWFAHSHEEVDPVVSRKHHDHIGFGCGGNFAHVPHTTQDNLWGWLCCCSFEFGGSQQGRVVGRTASSWHSSQVWSGNAVCAIMGSSGLEELNQLPTVHSWPPLFPVSKSEEHLHGELFPSNAELTDVVSLWFEEREKGDTGISSVLAKWRVCDSRYAIYLKTKIRVCYCSYLLRMQIIYLVSIINLSRCRNILPFCKLLKF
jgi:hypothetical protein